MTPIPFWVTEMNECCNGNKEVETEFENLEIGSSHGGMKGRDLGVTNDARPPFIRRLQSVIPYSQPAIPAAILFSTSTTLRH